MLYIHKMFYNVKIEILFLIIFLRIKRDKFYFSIHMYISNKLGHSLQHMEKEFIVEV